MEDVYEQTAHRISWLGIMGGGITRRILKNGFPLAVFNRNAADLEVGRIADF